MRCVEDSASGTYNVAGPATPLSEDLAVARSVAGHIRPLVGATNEWLVAHEVEEWAGLKPAPERQLIEAAGA